MKEIKGGINKWKKHNMFMEWSIQYSKAINSLQIDLHI